MKFGMTPGDIPTRYRASLLEERYRTRRGKALKNKMKLKERAVLNERTKEEIDRDL